jgi:hypothetical protein
MATPGLFSGLFRKEKFPNPKLSVGLHLQETRRGDHIWDAKGPAKDTFGQLEQEINSHLIKFGGSVYAEVKWTLCMIGRTKESSRPTVVFFCAERAPRQTVRAEIKSSGILKRYPGFVTMDCNRPPGFIEVMPLGEGSDGPTSNSPSQSRKDEHIGLANIEGAKIFIEGGNPKATGMATVGGILRWHDKYFITTVAHAFPGCRNVFEDMAAPSEFEYDIDSGGDDDELDDSVVETMSKGSMSSENSDFEDGKSSDESTRAGSMVTESQPVLESSVNIRGPVVMSSKGGKSKWPPTDPGVSVKFKQPVSNLSQDPTQEYTVTMQLNDGRQETLSPDLPPILSVEGQRPILDYALVEISRSQLDDFVGGSLKGIEQTKDKSLPVAQGRQLNKTSEIQTKVFPWSPLPGQLLATPSYMRSSGRYEELWTVRLRGGLEKGHCGAWTTDIATDKIYGHLIAGSPSSGFAYLIPLKEVISDLKLRFGGWWEVLRCSSTKQMQDSQLGVKGADVPSVDLDMRLSQLLPRERSKKGLQAHLQRFSESALLIPKPTISTAAPPHSPPAQSTPKLDTNTSVPPSQPTRISPTFSDGHRPHPVPDRATVKSSKEKKVHYATGTKGKSSHSQTKSHAHRSNHDSGIGSSSASDYISDEALLRTKYSSYNTEDVRNQRSGPTALVEALDVAQDKARELREENERLQSMLKEINKEKRTLREDKNDLIKEIEDLGQELEDEKRAHNRLRREVGGRRPAAVNTGSRSRSSSQTSFQTSNSQSRTGSSRTTPESGYYQEDSGRRYIVPPPPPYVTANPFMPLPERASSAAVTYAPATAVTYSPVPYSTAPTFAARPAGSRSGASSEEGKRNVDDNNYHSYPI